MAEWLRERIKNSYVEKGHSEEEAARIARNTYKSLKRRHKWYDD